MNKVFLIGNLTRDPELTETSGGVSICRFSIAVNRNYTNANGERVTDFFNCLAWRSTAEAVARYTQKGNKISVAGSLENRNYEDREGNKRTVTEIQVQEVEFLTPRAAESGREPKPNDYVAPPRQQSIYDKKPTLQAFDDDDDIPF